MGVSNLNTTDEPLCEQCHPTVDYAVTTGTHGNGSMSLDAAKVTSTGGENVTCTTASCHNQGGGAGQSTAWDVATKLACDDCHYYEVTVAGSRQLDEQLARVVEMRFFAGLTEQEVAAALGVTDRTVRRQWEKARRLLATVLADA